MGSLISKEIVNTDNMYIVKKDNKNYNIITEDNRLMIPITSVNAIVSKGLTEEEAIQAIYLFKDKVNSLNEENHNRDIYDEDITISYEQITNMILAMTTICESPDMLLETIENIKEGYIAHTMCRLSYLNDSEKGKLLYAFGKGDFDAIEYQKHL